MRIEFGTTLDLHAGAGTASSSRPWALVLAGGEGSRLRQITTDATGQPVPKQFCSLTGGRTLLQEAIGRAANVAATDRICTIVSESHRRWWTRVLARQPAQNVIVQPQGRGTGIGILYSAVHIARRDPEARLLILPSDHHVRRESTLTLALRNAMTHLDTARAAPILLGLRPACVDPELGYIVPAANDAARPVAVACFVEKPDEATARKVITEDGGLWNTFIMATPVTSLIELFRARFAPEVEEMQAIVAATAHEAPANRLSTAIVDLFERLPAIDMSRDILQRMTHALRLMRLEDCGWSDLGTPSRLGATLRELPQRPARRRRAPFVDLSQQHALYESHRAAAHAGGL